MSNSNGTMNLGNRRALPKAAVIGVLGDDGLPESVSFENPIPITESSIPGGAIPPNDTIVEIPSNPATNGGTMTWYQGGREGILVAQLTFTVAEGNTVIRRTA